MLLELKETNQVAKKSNQLLVSLATAWMLITAAITTLAAEQKTSRIADVDNTRMGAYRALAQVGAAALVRLK